MSNKKIILTQEGYDKLQEEYKELINVKSPANIQAIKEARSLGDLSENAEYDAARNEQAELESRIKYLEKILEHPIFNTPLVVSLSELSVAFNCS